MASSSVDRASAQDVMTLASDVGPAPMHVGAVLRLAEAPTDASSLVDLLGRRVEAVPRLHQRLVRPALGLGRPVWVDDPAFDPRHHVDVVACPAPADETALLALATRRMAAALPDDRPPWRATVITGLEDGSAAVLVVFHHVLADGIGGLAVLAQLVDGAPAPPERAFPAPAPPVSVLLADAWRTRLRALRRVGPALRGLVDGLRALRTGRAGRALRCSLLQRCGPRRRFVVVRSPLAPLRRAAHAHGGTVNDVVLAAAADGLRSLLQERGEQVDRFVVSVPVSMRRRTDSADLGNQVGVVPLEVPTSAAVTDQLAEIVRRTAAAKEVPRGASTSVLGPLFRALAAVGLFRPFVEHQRLVHTFVTNVHGPDEVLSLDGTPIVQATALSATPGDVTASFTVLSYAGTLAITIVADEATCPDVEVLRDALAGRLAELVAEPGEPGPGLSPPRERPPAGRAPG